jgi:AcrR family transcriptional regulator
MAVTKEIDPRSRRTRAALRRAVMQLMEEREIAEISVRDITTTADINRATFYLHYQDKDDLISQTVDAIFDEFTAEDRAFVDTQPQLEYETAPAPIGALFRHIADEPKLYRRLFGPSGPFAFPARLISFHEQQFQTVWQTGEFVAESGSPDSTLRSYYCAFGILGTLRWWIDHDLEPSINEMSDHLWQLIRPLWFENVKHPSDG